MTTVEKIKWSDEEVWFVASNLASKGAEIVIPVASISISLSNEEIGRQVRALMEPAMLRYADEMADYYHYKSGDHMQENELQELKPLFAAFAGRGSGLVDWALADILQTEERIALRKQARKTKDRKRSQVKTHYEQWFVAVGRRDGFRCARCGRTDRLQIDHVIPVSLNGSNELDNLQLLCDEHNLEKADSIIDYRGASC